MQKQNEHLGIPMPLSIGQPPLPQPIVAVPHPVAELVLGEPHVPQPAAVRGGGGADALRNCQHPDGCNKRALKGSGQALCWVHNNPNAMCTSAGCNKHALAGGTCFAHGGGIKCKHPEGCHKKGLPSTGGYCLVHGGTKPMCQHPNGCSSFAKNGDFCTKHAKQAKAGGFIAAPSVGAGAGLGPPKVPAPASMVNRKPRKTNSGDGDDDDDDDEEYYDEGEAGRLQNLQQIQQQLRAQRHNDAQRNAKDWGVADNEGGAKRARAEHSGSIDEDHNEGYVVTLPEPVDLNSALSLGMLIHAATIPGKEKQSAKVLEVGSGARKGEALVAWGSTNFDPKAASWLPISPKHIEIVLTSSTRRGRGSNLERLIHLEQDNEFDQGSSPSDLAKKRKV